MAVRVADPTRLRLVAAGLTGLGILWVPLTVGRGMLTLGGLLPLALGVSAFDAVRERRVNHRQAGLAVVVIAAGIALWSFFVIVFMGALVEGRASWVWYVMLVVSMLITAGGFVIRFRPDLAQEWAGTVLDRVQRGNGRPPGRRPGVHRATSRPREHADVRRAG